MSSSSFIELSEAGRSEGTTENDLLDGPFQIADRNLALDRLRRWRQAALVLNRSRRFRYTLDLKKEEERQQQQKKIRAHVEAIRQEQLLLNHAGRFRYSLDLKKKGEEEKLKRQISAVAQAIMLKIAQQDNNTEPIAGSSESEISSDIGIVEDNGMKYDMAHGRRNTATVINLYFGEAKLYFGQNNYTELIVGSSETESSTEPFVGSSETESSYITVQVDRSTNNYTELIVGSSETESSTEPFVGSSETESSYITVQVDRSTGDHEAHSRINTVWNQENNDTDAIVGSSGTENSYYLPIAQEDSSIGDHEGHGMRNTVRNQENNDTDAIIGSSETENSYILDIEDSSTGDHEAHSRRNIGWSRKVDFEWIFLVTNFFLELPSAALDELSSVHKPHYALAIMLMSFAAILICISDLFYKGRKERVIWRWRDTFPWFYYPSERCKPFGTFNDFIGLVCALCQCIVTTINYAFLHQHADSPIKISVWPIIFAFGLLCSKYLANSERRITS